MGDSLSSFYYSGSGEWIQIHSHENVAHEAFDHKVIVLGLDLWKWTMPNQIRMHCLENVVQGLEQHTYGT